MRVTGLTVSVDYGDLLEKVLPVWVAGLDDLLVVTVPRDRLTAQVCTTHNVAVLTTNVFFESGAEFNKSGGLDEGLAGLRPTDWLLVFDADILPPVTWRDQLTAAKPVAGRLYSANRVDTDGAAIPAPDWDLPGFFHLFHVLDSRARDRPLFGDWRNASCYDTVFAQRWGRENWSYLPFTVTHLGESGVNWCGRGNAQGMRELSEQRTRLRGWAHERLQR